MRLKRLIENVWTFRVTCIYPANKCSVKGISSDGKYGDIR